MTKLEEFDKWDKANGDSLRKLISFAKQESFANLLAERGGACWFVCEIKPGVYGTAPAQDIRARRIND